MWGAIIGDIVGSRFEGTGIKTKEFDLLTHDCRYTDDSVCTAAVAESLLDGLPADLTLRVWCHRRPARGYGGMFARWLEQEAPHAYGSFGNGAAMRVSPAAYLSTATVCTVSGVTRSFRPLPWQRTCAPESRHTSAIRKPSVSETRKPVCAVRTSHAWSRRPSRVVRSGAASNASTSPGVRKLTSVRSVRLTGMARMRWIRCACSGWRIAAKRNIERMAASRAFRVLTLLPRSHSRCSKEGGDEVGIEIGEVEL